MNNSRAGAEIAHGFSAMEAALGQVSWRLYVPSVDYKTYATAQKIVAGQLRRCSRYVRLSINMIVWITTFFTTLYITLNSSQWPKNITLIIMLFVIFSILILQIANANAIYKALHDVHKDQPCDVLIGQGGVLLLNDSCAFFTSWNKILSCTRVNGSLFLLTKYFSVIILPEPVLAQHPESGALVAFVEQEISNAGKA